MKLILSFLIIQSSFGSLPLKFTELLSFVEQAPDQGETNTCLYVASTGAMELLLNKKNQTYFPWNRKSFNLSESFLIWADSYYDPSQPVFSFIEEPMLRFNHGDAVLDKYWPFNAFKADGEVNMDVWEIHPKFDELPRIAVPKVEVIHLFAKGKKWATGVLSEEDLIQVKEALIKYKSPVIINYNDDDFWHVVLIVGFDDRVNGDCYQMEPDQCNRLGSLYVRDSNGHRVDARSYDWFIEKANMASVTKLKDQ